MPQISPSSVPEDVTIEGSQTSTRTGSADGTANAPQHNKSDYDLTTIDGLAGYLKDHHAFADFDLQPLTGGTANYVYRLTERDTQKSCILKHAAPRLASNPAFALSTSRMDFEANMLMKIGEDKDECHCTSVDGGFDRSTIEETHVHAAPLIFYDQAVNLLCVQDGGNRNLKAAYADLSTEEVQSIGTQLGIWLARLHGKTPLSHVAAFGKESDESNNLTGVAIAGFTYSHLADTLKMYGAKAAAGTGSSDDSKILRDYADPEKADALSNKVNMYSANLLPTDRECVCHGDFWPGNVTLQSSPKTPNHHLLTVIDWELTRTGTSATDIGQFAAEATMLDLFHGQKGLCSSFTRAYFQTSALVHGPKENLLPWLTRIALHYAVHLIVWPGRGVHWAPREYNAMLASRGVGVIVDAMSEVPDLRSWGLFDGVEGLDGVEGR